MLSVHRTITVYGRSVIDGTEVEGYQATIDEQKPDDVVFNSWQIDPLLYKKNRLVCRLDRNDFEDRVYKYQEKMIQENLEVDNGSVSNTESSEPTEKSTTTEPTSTTTTTTEPTTTTTTTGDGTNG